MGNLLAEATPDERDDDSKCNDETHPFKAQIVRIDLTLL